MKALIDEGVPRRFADFLRENGCDVSNFPNRWKGLKNGQLLSTLHESDFGCLLTSDRNLSFQQNVAQSKIALVVLPAQRFEDLAPLVSQVAEALKTIKPGDVRTISSETTKGS